jgi:hypothetical protein
MVELLIGVGFGSAGAGFVLLILGVFFPLSALEAFFLGFPVSVDQALNVGGLRD